MAPKPCLLCNDANSRLVTEREAYVTMDTYGIYAAASSGMDPVLRIQTTAYVTLPRALLLPGERSDAWLAVVSFGYSGLISRY
jgi:hypothetical protein